MFALPVYLQEHIDLLRLMGVRDALEMMPGSSVRDAAESNEGPMRWLFEHGDESFSDVVVHCDGGRLSLHRNILMARSSYFRAMFQGGEFGFREGMAGNADVQLLEAPFAVGQLLLGYLYHGTVDEAVLEGEDGPCNAVELLRLSDQLDVPYIFKFAQLWIANQQDLDDCADTLELASQHRALILEGATLSLMAANMDTQEVQQLLPRLSQDHRATLQKMAQPQRR